MSQSEKSARIHAMFEQLADAPPGVQFRLLAESGLDDYEKVSVTALLNADRSSESVLDASVADWIASVEWDELESESLLGKQIGHYRIDEFVGKGGSSVVFRATRILGDVKQNDVALKLLNARWLSAEASQRFRREQRILAHLSHPNIARMLDCGVSEHGVPYIGMEFVHGLELLEFAETRSLPLEGRLRLLEQLCRAADSAHRSLVVHRDLKPSNVLVTPEGHIKILDFGTAKLLESDDPVTLTQSIQLTPDYAAPEQYRSGPATTALDIYSLGVIASELLLGVRLGPDADWLECTTVTSSLYARRQSLDPDLAGILHTALAAEPQKRYQSAGHFADDIARFLRNEPLAVRVPSAAYRLRKFFARHRISVSATLFLTVAVLSSLAVAVWQSLEARHAAYLANTRADEARYEAARAISAEERSATVVSFLVHLFNDSNTLSKRPEAGDSIQTLESRAIAVERDYATQPDLRLHLLAAIGEIYSGMGDQRHAQRILERVVAELKERPKKDPLKIADVTRILARATLLQGDYNGAVNLLSGAKVLVDTNESPQYFDEMILILDVSATAHIKLGDMKSASHDLEEAIGYADRLGRADSAPMARIHDAYGRLFHFLNGDLASSRREFERAISIYRREGGAQSVAALQVSSNLGYTLVEQGELDAARVLLEAVSTAQREMLGERSDAYAGTLTNLGLLASKQSRFDDAMGYYIAAASIYDSNLGAPNYGTAYCATGEGDVEAARGNYAAAKEKYDTALALYRLTSLPDYPEIAAALNGRSEVLLRMKRPTEALADGQAALNIARKTLSLDHPRAVRALLNVGLAQKEVGDETASRESLAEATRRAERAYADDANALNKLRTIIANAFAEKSSR